MILQLHGFTQILFGYPEGQPFSSKTTFNTMNFWKSGRHNRDRKPNRPSFMIFHINWDYLIKIFVYVEIAVQSCFEEESFFCLHFGVNHKLLDFWMRIKSKTTLYICLQRLSSCLWFQNVRKSLIFFRVCWIWLDWKL